MTDSPLVYEELSLRAWPSLQSELFKGCVYGYAAGYTYRANSAHPLYTESRDYGLVIDHAETFYERFQQPSLFKLAGGLGRQPLDSLLADRGYEKTRESTVLRRDLSSIRPDRTDEVAIGGFTPAWLEAHAQFSGMPERDRDPAWQVLSRVAGEVIAASILVDGQTVACGFGALEGHYIGFFDVAVKKELRGKGFGRRLMTGLLDAGKQRGATVAYLQVLAANGIARNLYHSLGFEPAYSYWYRKRG